MSYLADSNRYDDMPYRRVGRSGLHLPDLAPPEPLRKSRTRRQLIAYGHPPCGQVLQ